MRSKSIDIIHEEHRALAAMLSGMNALVKNIAAGRLEPDFGLLGAMIEYIDKVPEVVHHPKENDYLFARLRERCNAAATVIEQLEAEHAQGAARIADLRAALEHYQRTGAAGLANFDATLKAYTEQEWHHMNTEERQVFPLAQKHLTAEDWAEIDAAFVANGNPWAGPAGDYAALFTKIVNIAPAPVGLGG